MSIQSMLLGSSAQPVDCSLSSASAYGSRSGAGTISSTGVLATALGGTPGFTYLWTYVSGDNTISISSSTISQVNWTGTVTLGGDKEARWQVVITDSLGQTSPPRFVDIFIQDTSFV